MSRVGDLDDVAARAMLALEGELAIPAELEARMLAAIPGLGEAAVDAAEALPPQRPPRRAARSPWRRSTVALAAAAVAFGVAATYAGGSWLSARRDERAAIARDHAAEAAAGTVAAIDWDDGGPWRAKMAALEELRKELAGPVSRAATVRLSPRYVAGLRRAFLDATRADLEAALSRPDADRDTLRAYELLGDPARLHAEGAWEADALTSRAAAAMASRTPLPVDELRAMLRPHLVAWIFLVETEVVPAAPVDARLIADARARLGSP